EEHPLPRAPRLADERPVRLPLDRHVPARRQAVDDAEADVVARGAVAPARVAKANHHPHELRLSPTLPPLSLAPFRLAAALAFGRRGLGGRRRRGTLGRHALGRYGFGPLRRRPRPPARRPQPESDRLPPAPHPHY